MRALARQRHRAGDRLRCRQRVRNEARPMPSAPSVAPDRCRPNAVRRTRWRGERGVVRLAGIGHRHLARERPRQARVPAALRAGQRPGLLPAGPTLDVMVMARAGACWLPDRRVCGRIRRRRCRQSEPSSSLGAGAAGGCPPEWWPFDPALGQPAPPSSFGLSGLWAGPDRSRTKPVMVHITTGTAVMTAARMMSRRTTGIKCRI